jgi:small subunit ribosomal protein S8
MIQSLACDFLIRLKNSSLAGNKTMTAPNSQFCKNIAEVLKKNKYIEDYSISEDSRELTLKLHYDNDIPAVSIVKLFSKPGRRWYEKSSSLPWGQSKESLIIISTSSGLMSQREAKKKGIGGEIIAEIC